MEEAPKLQAELDALIAARKSEIPPAYGLSTTTRIKSGKEYVVLQVQLPKGGTEAFYIEDAATYEEQVIRAQKQLDIVFKHLHELPSWADKA